MLTTSERTGTDGRGEKRSPYHTGPGRPCSLVFILKSDCAEDCRSLKKYFNLKAMADHEMVSQLFLIKDHVD